MDIISPELGIVFWTILLVLVLVLLLIALINILMNRFNGNDKLIWVLIVLLLPFFGSITYFVIGRSNRIK